MRILSIYISRELLKIFSFMTVFFIFFYSLFDFLEKANNFSEANIPIITMLSFFILQLPEIIYLMVPISMLMATIITLGLMNKHNEIMAIKSSGVSILRFVLPIFFISLALSIMMALLNETMLPMAKTKANYIWKVLVEKELPFFYHKECFYFKGQASIYQIGFYNPENQELVDIVYYQFDNNFNLFKRIDARRARFLGGKWIFFSGLYQERISDGYSVVPFDEQIIDLPELPADFNWVSKPSEEMTSSELAQNIKKFENDDYNIQRYRVDLHNKLSFPFVTLIMTLVGVPLILFKEKERGLAISIISGLIYAFLYWISFSTARFLFGYSGALPPIVSAWLPNGIFFLGALWLFSRISQ